MFCLNELNIWFMLARIGSRVPSEDGYTVSLALPNNTRIQWSMPKVTDILNLKNTSTANINVEG